MLIKDKEHEVRGGGKKPWRQKGTGRARQGSIRAPQWIKGGIALGPKPRSYSYKINKKEKALAVRSALSAKLTDKEIVVVDKLELKEIKTAEMAKILNNLNSNNALVVLADKNENVQKSIRNLPTAKVERADSLNVYDLLKFDKVILTEDSVKKIEEVYA